jgi:hypothetical protein
MSFLRHIGKGIRILARVGRPLLALIGVKSKTVAGKVVEGAEILDPLLGQDPTPKGNQAHPKP